MHQTKRRYQLSIFNPCTDIPNIPYFNGEDHNYQLDLFLYKIEEKGKIYRWNNSEYAIAVMEHLEGKAKKEFLKNPYWMTLTWNEIKRDLRIRCEELENNFLSSNFSLNSRLSNENRHFPENTLLRRRQPFSIFNVEPPHIPDYNGEDPNYPLDSFINKIKEKGEILRWSHSDYGIAIVTHLKGRPRSEFLKNQDWMTLSWNELQKDLRTRVNQSRNEKPLLSIVKKWFNLIS